MTTNNDNHVCPNCRGCGYDNPFLECEACGGAGEMTIDEFDDYNHEQENLTIEKELAELEYYYKLGIKLPEEF